MFKWTIRTAVCLFSFFTARTKTDNIEFLNGKNKQENSILYCTGRGGVKLYFMVLFPVPLHVGIIQQWMTNFVIAKINLKPGIFQKRHNVKWSNLPENNSSMMNHFTSYLNLTAFPFVVILTLQSKTTMHSGSMAKVNGLYFNFLKFWLHRIQSRTHPRLKMPPKILIISINVNNICKYFHYTHWIFSCVAQNIIIIYCDDTSKVFWTIQLNFLGNKNILEYIHII